MVDDRSHSQLSDYLSNFAYHARARNQCMPVHAVSIVHSTVQQLQYVICNQITIFTIKLIYLFFYFEILAK